MVANEVQKGSLKLRLEANLEGTNQKQEVSLSGNGRGIFIDCQPVIELHYNGLQLYLTVQNGQGSKVRQRKYTIVDGQTCHNPMTAFQIYNALLFYRK